jgi:hypothetical protein
MNILPTISPRTFKTLDSRLPSTLRRQAQVHRNDHTGIGWISSSRGLYQPQDGAPALTSRVTGIAERLNRGSREPEDARLTGGTRSLSRRLLGLNLTLFSADTIPRVA